MASSRLFDAVMASDGHVNLVGEDKRERLIASFGARGFDYIGNDRQDAIVWRAARRALFASATPQTVRSIEEITPVEKIFQEPSARWQDYLDALRPTHWVKNALLFVPLAAAHRVFEFDRLEHVALAFIAFDLCASGLYLLNDLLDLPADRRHPHKKERMLASGRIPLTYALLMMPLLLLGAFGLALHLSIAYAGVMGLYTALMVVYSMKLKDIPLVDVFVLAGGYALRVAAGAVAAQIRISAWLLTFCVFLFFSLALIKRYAELMVLEAQPTHEPVRARGYLSRDKTMLVAQGIASGYLAVMVLALYTNTEISQRLYARHDVFWGVCLLLFYWVSYVWMAALRGRIVGDPVMFALSDRVSRWSHRRHGAAGDVFAVTASRADSSHTEEPAILRWAGASSSAVLLSVSIAVLGLMGHPVADGQGSASPGRSTRPTSQKQSSSCSRLGAPKACTLPNRRSAGSGGSGRGCCSPI